MRVLILLPAVLAVSVSTGFCASPDFVGNSSPFAVEKTTEVPGDTLKAGSYSISITEQIADRMIVRLDSTTSKNHAIFLGVPTTMAKMGGSAAGLVNWPVGVHKTPTLRGFIFPNGNVVEFVYPKAEAAELTQENGVPVVAVDPRSEGRAVLKSLSQDELQIVNLWLLSLTSTGLDNKTPAVLAQRYDATRDVQQPTVASGVAPIYPIQHKEVPQPQTATASPAYQPAGPAPVAIQATPAKTATIARRKPAAPLVSQSRPVPAVPEQVAHADADKFEQPTNASFTRRTLVPTQLPHTASELPLVWLAGLLSLLAAAFLRFGRWTSRPTVD